MKQKQVIPTLLLVLLATTALADAGYATRNKCLGFLGWKYKSWAQVWPKYYSPLLTSTGSSNSNSCSPNSSTAFGYDASTWTSIDVKAYAYAGSSGSQSYVNFYGVGMWNKFSAGLTTNMLEGDMSFAPMYEGSENKTTQDYEGSFADISNSSIDFDDNSHKIHLTYTNARIGVDDPDIENGYATFKIWLYDITSATSEEDMTVISTLQAFILNGELLIEGNGLYPDDFTKDPDRAVYSLSDFTISLAVPESIDLDDVLVKVGTDAGNLGDGIDEDFKMNFNQPKYAVNVAKIKEGAAMKLDIMGNPAANTLNFVVANGTRTFTNASISILAGDGKIVKRIYDGAISTKEQRFNVDIASLATGAYYLTVVTNTGEKFARKFIKQ